MDSERLVHIDGVLRIALSFGFLTNVATGKPTKGAKWNV